MPNLFYAQEELNHAKEAFKRFKQTNGPHHPLNKDFQDFVIHLDLVFIKAERGCQDIRNKFEPFQGQYKKLRREDPLLSYLKNARDAINHGMEIICDLQITSERKITSYIDISHVDKEGSTITEKVPMYAAEIKLQKFNINGKDWLPPISHLGTPLYCKGDPSEVADLAFQFYEDFLSEIKRKFCK
ncbi:hypothetical protein [uncultured Sphingobacterium sp.]|uniref:hypothetical protein n=1 Tax=uncultured Sphingobacterium sp. TaxID=182688 RepID=UPI0037494E98